MKRKRLLIISAIVVVVAGVLIFNRVRSSAGVYQFETVKPEQKDISNTVTATGTLEAIVTVEVGTQVSGVIEKIYVDYNSNVKQGQLLANIDETPLKAQLEQSQASVDDAEAELIFQTANYNRLKTLFEKQLIAQTDFDQATYSFNRARAALSNAKSVYNRNKINLDYATILSPIDGVVLSRVVDEGQTVAAGFTTPTLFTIANDLTRMQVEASVDEADIGKVHNGQRVDFTVDAYPEQVFAGTVSEVRLMPSVTSNVVTYTVIINAPNPEKKLMPGMTASTVVYVEERNDAMVIPARALRYTPDQVLLTDYFNSLSGEENLSVEDMAGIPLPDQNTAGKERVIAASVTLPFNQEQEAVWIKNGNEIRRVEVQTGINTGFEVEILSGLEETDEVLLMMSFAKPGEEDESEGRSFMPPPPGGR